MLARATGCADYHADGRRKIYLLSASRVDANGVDDRRIAVGRVDGKSGAGITPTSVASRFVA